MTKRVKKWLALLGAGVLAAYMLWEYIFAVYLIWGTWLSK